MRNNNVKSREIKRFYTVDGMKRYNVFRFSKSSLEFLEQCISFNTKRRLSQNPNLIFFSNYLIILFMAKP